VLILQAESDSKLYKNAAEFLLEPWVLLQIPFQPAMLHQWAVALLAESMIFQQKISPIYCFGFSHKFNFITEHLRLMLLAMRDCANFFLKLYVTMCVEGQRNNFHSALQPNFELFSNHLTAVFPIIEFATSDEANSMIRSIVNICVEEINAGIEVINPPQIITLDVTDEPTPLYDFWFWTRECDLMEMCTGALDDRGTCNSHFQSHVKKNRRSKISNAWHCLLKKLVDEKIIQTGRLRGVEREKILTAVKKHSIGLNTYCVYFHNFSSMYFLAYFVFITNFCVFSCTKLCNFEVKESKL
jgi:hypothetical protein